MQGATVIVYGEQAEMASRRLLGSLEAICRGLPVHIHRRREGLASDCAESRYAKVTMFDWVPFDHFVYLDADTQVIQPINAGFEALGVGWDMVIAPSQNQDEYNWLWHCGTEDKEATREAVGYRALQLQAGMMFVAKNERTETLWKVWQEEWLMYGDQDQGALLRAFHRAPVRVWLLGRPWNGGAVIGHHWGAIRRGWR